MSFVYPCCIRFRDTDAAGVVFFANVLALCHDAYEASLAAAGVNLTQFFGGRDLAVPIGHTACDFYRPLRCGDELTIRLTPTRLSPSEFSIAYVLELAGSISGSPKTEASPLKLDVTGDRPYTIAARAITRHVAIDRKTHRRVSLPQDLVDWIDLMTGESDAPPSAGVAAD